MPIVTLTQLQAMQVQPHALAQSRCRSEPNETQAASVRLATISGKNLLFLNAFDERKRSRIRDSRSSAAPSCAPATHQCADASASATASQGTQDGQDGQDGQDEQGGREGQDGEDTEEEKEDWPPSSRRRRSKRIHVVDDDEEDLTLKEMETSCEQVHKEHSRESVESWTAPALSSTVMHNKRTCIAQKPIVPADTAVGVECVTANLSPKEACELFRGAACYDRLLKTVTKEKHFPLEWGIEPWHLEPVGNPRPSSDLRKGMDQQLRVTTEQGRVFDFWLHQDDLSVAGCKYWLKQCILEFTPRAIVGTSTDKQTVRLKIQATIRPELTATVECPKEEWLEIFEGDSSPLGQAFLKCLDRYDEQPEDVRISVPFPVNLSGGRGRRRKGTTIVAAFRSLLEDQEDTLWMQQYLRGVLASEHHSLVDFGPTQLETIAAGQLLPKNVVPSPSSAMRLLIVALHCYIDGNTSLTVVSNGVRSFSCDGATPPFITVVEHMLSQVKRLIVIMPVCGGWVRYRSELADLARRRQIIFVLTSQATVNLRDPVDSVLSLHFRLTAALVPVLDALARSATFNSDASIDGVMPKLLSLVLRYVRPIYGDSAHTTQAEVLTHEGEYVSLAPSSSAGQAILHAGASSQVALSNIPMVEARISVDPHVSGALHADAELRTDIGIDPAKLTSDLQALRLHVAGGSSAPALSQQGPSFSVPAAADQVQTAAQQPSSSVGVRLTLDRTIPEPSLQQQVDPMSIYCRLTIGRRFANAKRQQLQDALNAVMGVGPHFAIRVLPSVQSRAQAEQAIVEHELAKLQQQFQVGATWLHNTVYRNRRVKLTGTAAFKQAKSGAVPVPV